MVGKSGFSRWATGLGVGLLMVQGSGCGMTVKRDLSASKPGVVVYDDMCGLQNYFDALKDSTIATPREISAQELADENGKTNGGTVRYRFETEFQLHHLRQLLVHNWGGIPDEVDKAPALDVEVRWSEKASVKRVVTTEPAVLAAGEKQFVLPYHVCLSDLLFGESLYNTRRVVLQLPAPPRSQFSKQPMVRPELGATGVAAAQPAPSPEVVTPGVVEVTATVEAAPMATVEMVKPAPAPVGAPAGETPVSAPPK